MEADGALGGLGLEVGRYVVEFSGLVLGMRRAMARRLQCPNDNFAPAQLVFHAADAGYRAIVASDGTSTVDDEWQNVALNYAMQNVASVGTCAEIAGALKS